MRDIDDLRRKSALAIADLLQTQIEVGVAYCVLAEQSSSREKQERLVGLAQRELDSANEWMWRIGLEHEFFDALTARIDFLKLKVASIKSDWK